MNTQAIICLAIFVLMLVGLCQKKISGSIVCLVAIVVLCATHCLDFETAGAIFGQTNVIMMLFMFPVITALNRTSLVDRCSELVSKVGGGSFRSAFCIYVLMLFLLEQVGMNGMQGFMTIAPFVISLCLKHKRAPSKYLLPMCVASSQFYGVLPIGSGAIGYMYQNMYLEAYGADLDVYSYTIMTSFWTKIVPIIIFMIFIMFFAEKLCPDVPLEKCNLQIAGANTGEKKKLAPRQEFMVILAFVLVLAGLLTYSKLGIPGWFVTFVGMVIVLLSGVLTINESVTSVPWAGIFIFYGAYSVGSALAATGASEMIGNGLMGVLGGVGSPFVLMVIYMVITAILANMVQGSGAMSIMRPLLIMAALSAGTNPVNAMQALSMGGTLAVLTPMSSITMATCMPMGGYTQKDLLKFGIPVVIYFIVAYSIMIPIVSPFYL